MNINPILVLTFTRSPTGWLRWLWWFLRLCMGFVLVDFFRTALFVRCISLILLLTFIRNPTDGWLRLLGWWLSLLLWRGMIVVAIRNNLLTAFGSAGPDDGFFGRNTTIFFGGLLLTFWWTWFSPACSAPSRNLLGLVLDRTGRAGIFIMQHKHNHY